MNIFAFNKRPFKSALWLDDVRKNKMILETAQMLSTAIHHLDPHGKWPVYNVTHPNHPCNVWARASEGNFIWLFNYLCALDKQKPKHKSAGLIPVFAEFLGSYSFAHSKQTPFANCARRADIGVDFTHVKPTTKAYRQYINKRWELDTIRLTWFYGEKPSWAVV